MNTKDISQFALLESQLFGPVFKSSFSMPLLQPNETKTQINRNLILIVGSIFDPIESIKQEKIDPINKRVTPYFNKYYSDLSCE